MRKLKRQLYFQLYYFVSALYIPVMYYFAWKFGQLKHLHKDDFRVWRKSMLSMLREYSKAAYNYRMHQILHAFALSKFEIVRKTTPCGNNDPIVVLCVKNDLARIKMLVEHYRKYGVKKFAFLDNNSTDGTFEWLLEQNDIDLFRTTERYQTAVKEGWINRLVSHYGMDRWYVITDSDELMTWIGMEEHPIQDLVHFAQKTGLKRFKGLTLDTYTKETLFAKSENIRMDYRYVDSDSYQEKESRAGLQKIIQYIGGPRNRLMGVTVPLSKYPLAYFEKGTISPSAHFLYPHALNNDCPCYIGILHYKFIDKDLQEFKRRAHDNSGFSSNGLHYKKMVEFLNDECEQSFMYEGSIEFIHSSALRQISQIEEIVFSA